MSTANDPRKEEALRKRSFAFRLNVFFFAIFLLFSVLIVRLAFLQFVEGADINEVLAHQETRMIPIAPIRGNIYDRKNSEIAYSTSTQSIYFRLEAQQTKDDIIRIAYELDEIFRTHGDGNEQFTPESIISLMDAGYDLEGNEVKIDGFSFHPRRIKSGLTQEEMAHIMERWDSFPGVEIIEESIRNYDPDRVAVQLIGYMRPFTTAVGQENISYLNRYKQPELASSYLDEEPVGYAGLEFMYQDVLRGKEGTKTYPVNNMGRIIGEVELTKPEKGNNLHLTIDKDVQQATQQAILDHLEYLQTPAARRFNSSLGSPTTGFAVAMEVDTGAVVSMASMPDYDPNIWNGGRWIYTTDYSENEPFFPNGTISESYPDYPDIEERGKHPSSLVPLGSIIKPLTILVGLNEGLITPNQTYYDSGVYQFGRDGRIQNSGRAHFGLMDAVRSLQVSSNTYMAELIGNGLFMREFEKGDGNQSVLIWDEYMEQFGLGVRTGSGLPNEIRGTKNYLDLEQSGSAQAAMVFASFGQGGRYTTLQLAQFTTMLANRGKRLKPQFVDHITTFDGELVSEMEPEVLNEVEYPDSYWNTVQRGMERVNPESFRDFAYTYASKTGTSQQDVAGGLSVNNATFIAYAPAENPKLAVAVVVPEGGFGTSGAAPIARAIFDAYDEFIGLVD